MQLVIIMTSCFCRYQDDKMKIRNAYVIAGPNGSGKTTFAKKFLPDYAKCPNFVKADLIAQGLSPFSPIDYR